MTSGKARAFATTMSDRNLEEPLCEEVYLRGDAKGLQVSSLSSITVPSTGTTSTTTEETVSLQEAWSTQTVVKSNEPPSTLQNPDDSRDFTINSKEFTASGTSFGLVVPLPSGDTTSTTGRPSFSRTCLTSPKIHSPSHRKVNKLDDSFTINQLQFSKASNHLVGRAAEMEMLERALTRVSEQQSKELVLLSGYSGTGKSALAKSLRRHLPERRMHGLYIQGKFDLQQRNNQPYTAIAIAVGSLCGHLLTLQQNEPERFAEVRATLLETLGTDLPVLSRVFGTLQEVLDAELNEAAISATQNPLEVKHRLVYAFCRFMRVMSVTFSPLVLVLDDLQWADGPSLDLVEALLMDRADHSAAQESGRATTKKRSAGGMLLVGIYRSNEVDSSHLLSSRLREWRERAPGPTSLNSPDACPFGLQEIEVKNLPFSAIHEYVSGILSSKDSETLGLAELCHRRTHGNIFFLIHFLRLLHRDELLRYNFGTLQWKWDLNEIELKTVASDNVVDLLLQKMNDLSDDETNLLKLASCLGASFDKDMLQLLWQSKDKTKADNAVEMPESDSLEVNDCTDMNSALERLIVDGYLQMTEKGTFQFAHDKVEEAASLLNDSSDNEASFHKWVGEVLLYGLGPQELESVIFVVVNLLNESGMPTSQVERLSLAQLNRRAGVKAMEVSAYEAACSYVSMGISLLGEHPFGANYELALDLFSTGAEAEAARGNASKMEEYCRAVMDENTYPIDDKLRVYTTWLASLANRGEIAEAASQTISLLERFGVRFPRNRVMQAIRTILSISKVKRGLKQGLLEKIVDLPIEKDPTRIRLLHLLDRLSVYLYYMHDDLMPLIMLRNFEWTLKYGLNDVTPAALTTLGIIFAGPLGDLRSGSDLASAALKLIPKVSPLVESRTLFTAHGFGVVWTQPMRDQLKPLLRAYELGLCCGDAESACWAIHLFYHQRYLTSFSLDLCIADVEMYLPQMLQLNQVVAYRSTLVNYQMFMNLAGRTDTDPLSLSGEFCTPANHADWYANDPFYHQHCRLWECYVRTLYGEHEECAKLVVKYGNNTTVKSNPATFSMSMFEVISKGVSSAVAARTTKKRAYRKNALAIHKRIKDWIDKGNPNVAHLDAFLDGQFSAMAGKQFAAIKSLQVSIVIAARGGLLLDAALFSECFGEYLIELGDSDEAVFRLQEAIKYYREFGARRKERLLETKYVNLWPKPRFVMATQEADSGLLED